MVRNKGWTTPNAALPYVYYSPSGQPQQPFTGFNTSHAPYIPFPTASPGPIYQPSAVTLPTNESFYGNRAPLEDEMRALRETLAMKQSTATFLDVQIKIADEARAKLSIPYQELKLLYESADSSYHVARESLESLIHLKKSVEPSIEHIRSLLHPIRRINSDCLSWIFQMLVDLETQNDHLERESPLSLPRYRRRHAALDISHVCRGWRFLAHQTPGLWSQVRLSLSRRSGAVDKLKLFTRFAKACPMDLSIFHLQPSYFPHNYSNFSDSDDGDNQLPLFHCIPRLRSLAVHFSHYRALSCLQRLGVSQIEHLEELTLRSEATASPMAPDFSLTSYLATAKRLRKLTLAFVCITLGFHDENFTLPEVSTLIVHSPTIVDGGCATFHHLLAMCPNAKRVVYFQNDSVPTNPTSNIELPLLRSLTINTTALGNSIQQSFCTGKVNAPKLNRVVLINDGQDPSIPLGAFLAALPALKALELSGDFDPLLQPPPHYVFRHAPPIHILVVERATRKFMEALCKVDEQGVALSLPFLSSLRIDFGKPACLTMMEEEIQALFRTRCDVDVDGDVTSIGVRPLNELVLSVQAGMREEVVWVIRKRMKCLSSQGDTDVYYWDAKMR